MTRLRMLAVGLLFLVGWSPTAFGQTNVLIHIVGPGPNAKFIQDGSAMQADVTVQVGQTVRFSNESNTTHNATSVKTDASNTPLFRTMNIAVGASEDVAMTSALYSSAGGAPGGSVELPYLCTRHPATMKSKLILRDHAVTPPTTTPLRVRKNIKSLTAAELTSLKNGVAAMKARPVTDPRSWQFQANIHGMNGPSTNPLFRQCEHGTEHFLTWHRAYLNYFESILRDASGDANLTLPYWDWTTDRDVPAAFRDSTAGNPLFHNRQMNNGSLLPTQLANEVNDALSEPDYFNLNFSIENPHGSVHVLVGGSGRDMSSIGRSANDPIFWLHHCNIDRLWNVWLNQSGNQNPTDPAFLDQQYSFADATGATATVKVKDFINSASLGYRYDMVPNPPPSGQPEFVAATDSRPAGGHGAATARPSVLVASSRKESTTDTPQEPVKLSFAPKSFELTLQPNGQGALESAADSIPGTGRVVVDIVGLKCKTPPSFTYGVYVNLPEGETNESALNLRFAGTVNLFGIADSDSGEHSKLRTVDVTKVIGRLKRASQFNPSKVTISLRPLAPVPAGGLEAPDQDQAHRNSAEQAAIQFERIDVRVVR